VLEKRFETVGQYWRTIPVPQFIDDHARSRWLLQQCLCNLGVRVNTGRIDRTDPCACDRCNIESPELAIGRQQLHRVAHASLKELCQARADNDRAGVIPKIIKAAVNQLMLDIGGSCVEGGIDTVKVDCRVLKTRASAYSSAQNRRTGNHVGELSAHPHDFVGVSDPFKIKTAVSGRLGVLRGDHEWLISWAKTRSDDERAIAADVGLDEIAGEALRLCLRADEYCDAENDAAQTQKQCPLAMR